MREIDNVINRARILAEDNRITVGDLPSEIIEAVTPASSSDPAIAEDSSLREKLRRYEVELLAQALREAGGERKAAAQRLGIALSILYPKPEQLERPGSKVEA